MLTVEDLLSVLEVGEQNAKHVNDIGIALNYPRQGSNNDPLRTDIRELIRLHELPIGSSKEGYFIIDTETEFINSIQLLEKRIRGTNRRIDAIREGWKKRKESRNNGENWPL